MFTYEEGKSGLEVDKDDLQSQINSIVEKGNASGTYTGTVTVTRTATQPKYDVAFLKKICSYLLLGKLIQQMMLTVIKI